MIYISRGGSTNPVHPFAPRTRGPHQYAPGALAASQHEARAQMLATGKSSVLNDIHQLVFKKKLMVICLHHKRRSGRDQRQSRDRSGHLSVRRTERFDVIAAGREQARQRGSVHPLRSARVWR